MKFQYFRQALYASRRYFSPALSLSGSFFVIINGMGWREATYPASLWAAFVRHQRSPAVTVDTRHDQ